MATPLPLPLSLPLHREPTRERTILHLEAASLHPGPESGLPRRLARVEARWLGDHHHPLIQPDVMVLGGRFALDSAGIGRDEHARD